jgi:hypothetical protein
MAAIKNWTKPIHDAQESSNVQLTSNSNFDVAIPLNPNSDQTRIINVVKFLDVSAKRHKSIQADAFLRNFELMAFAISWFGMVS